MKLSKLLFLGLAPAALAASSLSASAQVVGGVTTLSGAAAAAYLNTVSGSGNTGGKAGTFQYSGSAGANNNFAVGTSTGIGVNASASSTADYAVTSNGTLKVDGSSMKQSIGTSGITDQMAAQAATASSTAMQKTNESYGSNYAAYQAMDAATRPGNTVGTTKTAYASEAEYNSAKQTAYTANYNAYTSSQSFSDAKNGIISGQFSQVGDAGNITKTTTEYQTDASGAQKTAANSSGFVASQSVVSESTTQSRASSASNNVTVAGIGNSATVQAAAGSSFSSDIKARTVAGTVGMSNSATANGSAGANLSSTATANSSNTNFTSTFVQSF